MMSRRAAAAALVMALVAVPAAGQPQDRELPNAALRYWMAFAQMEDPPADDATARLLAEVEAGRAPWDEGRLASIVRANATAVATLRRASALARCDWGLEAELGPFTPVEHLARARVLARLNTLSGVRAASLGSMDDAVDAWIAGVRFSQHMAEGGSLLAVLSGRAALRSAVQAMILAAEKGQLTETHRTRIGAALAMVPATGFAWDEALAAEQRALDIWVTQLAKASDFTRAYQQATGAPPPAGVTLPSASAVSVFQAFMRSAADAFSLTPDRTRTALPRLDDSMKGLHPFYQSFIPSLARVNDTRADVKAERDRLLAAIASPNE